MGQRATLGWNISPFGKESPQKQEDVLIFKPILVQEEVQKCFVELPRVKDFLTEAKASNFNTNYLFLSHPRTGKTSLLAYLSYNAQEYGLSVLYFTRQSKVPSIDEFIIHLSTITTIDERVILVFDNIHEDKEIILLIDLLHKQRPDITIWCASRISEFVDIKDQWSQIKKEFTIKELPGYLDKDDIKSFLNKFRDLIDRESEQYIDQYTIAKENVSAYYLVDFYKRLKQNSDLKSEISPRAIIEGIAIDVEEDNRRTFGGLLEIERLALKIISWLDVAPKDLIEKLLIRSDSQDGNGVIDSLINRKVVFIDKTTLDNGRNVVVEKLCIFDSFKEFIKKQMYKLDLTVVIPGLILDEGNSSGNEFAVIALLNKYESLSQSHRDFLISIIIKYKENPNILWIASYLAFDNVELLTLGHYAYESRTSAKTIAYFGHAFSHAGDYVNAIKFITEALQHEEHNTTWQHELGHCYDKIGKLEEAIHFLKKSSEIDFESLNCLAKVYFNSDQNDKAIECLFELKKHKTLTVGELEFMGQVYFKKDDFENAKVYFGKALEVDTKSIESIIGMITVQLVLGEFSIALEHAQHLILLKPENESYWALYTVARIKHNVIRAEDNIEERIKELNLHLDNYFYETSRWFRKIGDVENELSYLEKTISVNQVHFPARVDIGTTFYNSFLNIDRAYEEFLIAVTINPDESNVHKSLGNCYSSSGDFLRAREEYQKAIDLLSPDESSEIVQSAHSIHKNLDNAYQNYHNLKMPNNTIGGNEINESAYELCMVGELEKAREMLDVGLMLYEGNVYLHATNGLCHFKQGNLELGVKYYETAIELDKDDFNLIQRYRYEYGRCLRINKQFEKALNQFGLALQTKSNYIPKRLIHEEIDKAKNQDTASNAT